MNDIGFAYMYGLGLRKSKRWAIYWFEKSAKRGCPDAMGNLSDIYLFSNDKYQNIERDSGKYLAQILCSEIKVIYFPEHIFSCLYISSKLILTALEISAISLLYLLCLFTDGKI